MDKLIKKTNLALVVGTNSWREQFIEAITVSAGEFGPGELQSTSLVSQLGCINNTECSGAAGGKTGGRVIYSICINKTAA